jgi:endonuclease III
MATRKGRLTVPNILNQLEAFYGKQEPCWPSDPYLFLLWWYCGYPASDASCSKGWKELTGRIGTDSDAMLAAHPAKLTAALKPGGMLPELRAERMKEVIARIKNEFDGDLRASLAGPITKIRKVLKSFPSIADPGADRILLFAGIQPVAAVPSNCTGVLERIQNGHEEKNYNASYREAQRMIDSKVPATFDARIRAYLLLKRHGQELYKRTKPKCEICPVRAVCAFCELSNRHGLAGIQRVLRFRYLVINRYNTHSPAIRFLPDVSSATLPLSDEGRVARDSGVICDRPAPYLHHGG